MRTLWNESEAAAFEGDPLALRVYTSRLIGQEPDLVLHGGGNTSVKVEETDLFGDTEEILCVKGSGWDLETIEPEGFAPVRMSTLMRMADLDELSDAEMVRLQRAAMTDPGAPTPSVEAILHALIPFRFVDHTHADAVVTITNTPDGMERIGEIYGDRVIVVPYVMPGFRLAREVRAMTRDIDWHEIEGMILLNHGVFTFGDDARSSYERMIQIVTEAEDHLDAHAPYEPPDEIASEKELEKLARMRQAVSRHAGVPVIARIDRRGAAVGFSKRDDAGDVSTRGPLTPDHVIRTKRGALVVGDDPVADVDRFAEDYRAYFERNDDGSLTCLDPAPRWAVWPGHGTIAFGRGYAEAGIVSAINAHTTRAIERAVALGGWEPVDESDLFEVEYWELEQAKLARAGQAPPQRGKVAFVTGGASGIGRACVEKLHAEGAAVAAVDLDDRVLHDFDGVDGVLPLVCDVGRSADVEEAVDSAVRRFGGVDIVVSNAGVFPDSATIAEMPDETWEQSLAVNLSGHRNVLQNSIPYLELGIDPAVVIVGSKNVAAPGVGAAAYSVAKAGLTQLARVAALELAAAGIRVNMVHPNDVFDTAIWTDEVLSERARHYGMTVEEYRRRNLLRVEISSTDVAALVAAMAGPLFSRTTGAQVSIDGGTDRTI